ncbi:hypothetical protein STEG23_016984 [Scotinomys teguina]
MEVVCSIPHPEYQVSLIHLNHDHDIMLLELKSPVQLSSHICTLTLSPDDCLLTGTCCRVSGWDTTISPQVNYPKTLQCANIELCSDEECQQVYPRKITANMLCADDLSSHLSSAGPINPNFVSAKTQALISQLLHVYDRNNANDTNEYFDLSDIVITQTLYIEKNGGKMCNFMSHNRINELEYTVSQNS